MSTDDLSSNIVPLDAGLSLKFYEAVLLLYSLKEVKFEAKSVKEPEADLESDTGRSSRDSFRCFVNKLGQICDSELRGKTVTAFAVLQPGGIQYRFASNQRTNEELQDVKKYITNILGILGSTPDDQLNGVFGAALERVISFNRPAIQQQIKNLTKQEGMNHCVKVCQEEDTSEGRKAALDINTLRRFAWLSEREERGGPSLKICFMRDKARADRDPNSKTPWSELRHAFSRLQSYNIAVRTLISMRRRRRELFEDFEVVPVPSSVRSGCPNVRRTLDGIIKRFPEQMKMAQACHTNLPEEQRGAVENKIKACTKGKFKPYVHAELVLLDSILTEQREGEPLRFFAEADYDRYIGCSKPTCRLCKLYIDNHPSGVEFRHGHCNVYHEWRAPDIYNEDGVNVAEAMKTRQDIHYRMLETLRQTIKRWITDNVAERKLHDSNTNATSYIGGGSSTYNAHLSAQASPDNMDCMSTMGAVDDSDDVATMFGGLSLGGDSGQSWSPTSVSRSSQDTTPVQEDKAGSPRGLSMESLIDKKRRRPLIIEVEE
ncbi:hypothetical protein NEUTE1DRAFT_86761 [Neurospora tetrasperma FGSC 2508]|uniref:Uncharacterized protein n=1 Tax=Neurospora tetrasperma (strain FGSC 2508 / ATCC MYA-4615 / P0657) TaxID=510951 RepID=F8MT09_NEUT8|nr:uncharacterized protein NEUTE1DRAFT_86761 [Neurospora tetrasperma FGSC 2508]EGO55991.1 hypothetical protein NEUTE1DRAFT_86761 [Neurospora tetrasperma FGSC 2508]EGZ68744.1 hypothetical protein NEUTE2DRAFT_159385 [Neurospora tetrasperma FGSC 2509]